VVKKSHFLPARSSKSPKIALGNRPEPPSGPPEWRKISSGISFPRFVDMDDEGRCHPPPGSLGGAKNPSKPSRSAISWHLGGAEATPGGATRPRDGASRPRDGATRPRDGATRPRDGASRPRDGASRPRDGASRPRDGATRPRDGATRPRDGASRPRDGATRLRGRASSTLGKGVSGRAGHRLERDDAVRKEGERSRPGGRSACPRAEPWRRHQPKPCGDTDASGRRRGPRRLHPGAGALPIPTASFRLKPRPPFH